MFPQQLVNDVAKDFGLNAKQFNAFKMYVRLLRRNKKTQDFTDADWSRFKAIQASRQLIWAVRALMIRVNHPQERTTKTPL
ncbi:MAG TPA: hypothetical protein VLI92_03590 [Candidatus Saccharimonadales bacterium]|nr:hypothetical protein [Candidatus Saccharimonadales bacterium]